MRWWAMVVVRRHLVYRVVMLRQIEGQSDDERLPWGARCRAMPDVSRFDGSKMSLDAARDS